MAADRKPTTEHRPQQPILNVAHFEPRGAGPRIAPITVVAALTPSTNYPRSRITLCSILGSSALTVHQAAALRDQLETAIAEVLAACPVMSTPDDVSTLPKEPNRG